MESVIQILSNILLWTFVFIADLFRKKSLKILKYIFNENDVKLHLFIFMHTVEELILFSQSKLYYF